MGTAGVPQKSACQMGIVRKQGGGSVPLPIGMRRGFEDDNLAACYCCESTKRLFLPEPSRAEALAS